MTLAKLLGNDVFRGRKLNFLILLQMWVLFDCSGSAVDFAI